MRLIQVLSNGRTRIEFYEVDDTKVRVKEILLSTDIQVIKDKVIDKKIADAIAIRAVARGFVSIYSI